MKQPEPLLGRTSKVDYTAKVFKNLVKTKNWYAKTLPGATFQVFFRGTKWEVQIVNDGLTGITESCRQQFSTPQKAWPLLAPLWPL